MAYFFPVILFITLFFSQNSVYSSSLLTAPDFRIWSPDGSGGWNINYGSKSTGGTVSGNAQVLSGGTQLRHHNLWDIPSSNGKSYRVPLSHTSVVDVSKVGSRLGSLARLLSPVGMAIGTAAYICTETSICDQAGEWLFSPSSEFDIFDSNPSCSSVSSWPSISVHTNTSWHVSSPDTLVEATSFCPWTDTSGSLPVNSAFFLYKDNCSFCSSGSSLVYVRTTAGAMPNGQLPSGDSRTPTQADWEAAEQILNQPASTEHIINNGGTVPADSSSPPSLDGAPVSQPIGTTTTTLYDANNNATGTQTKETTLTITDGATLDAPNQITYNETTVINNYDLSNNLIDRTVVDTSAPPPAPPEIGDIEIEFDSVSENELEEYETPDMDDWTSWGSGSCPPPISINTNNWNGTLDTQPMCDFAEGINPFVLLFAALISAYIVAGIRTSGH